MEKYGRNNPCPCGSGKKYKQCCLQRAANAVTNHPGRIAMASHGADALQAAQEHHRAGRLHQAEAIYQQMLSVEANRPDILHYLGMVTYQLGKFDEAVACMQKAITLNPGYVQAHNNLGNMFQALGRLEEAVAHYRQALALEPGYVGAYNNLGNVLQAQGLLDEAMACYRKALSLQPDYVDAHNNLGKVYQEQGRLDEAIACYQKVLLLQPGFVQAHNNLGNLFQTRGQLEEAENCLRRALSFKPDYANAHYNLGNVLQEQGRLGDAIACYRKALELEPEYFAASAQLLNQLQKVCEWGELDAITKLVRQAVWKAPVTIKNRVSPFSFLAMPGTTAAEQKRCAEKWVQATFAHRTNLRSALKCNLKQELDGKIRIGYLSPDFREHPVAHLMAEVFELHDRQRFYIVAYSYGLDDGSPLRKRLQGAFDKFVDIRSLSHENAAKRICDDGIDILVDLAGYTQYTRSEILSFRPAPIQVNYLGYPGTMGANFVDYLIADQFVIPSEYQRHYTEQVMWLPGCYMPRDSSRVRLVAPSRKDCGLPEEGVVFCSFNQFYKITPQVFDVWCRLLRAVPGSVLWLPAGKPLVEANLAREAESRGVEAARLLKAPRLDSVEEHLARLQCADLFLDTMHYNAHTTCSDALWMGLPVITCAGETFPSRVAGSLLTAIGAPELVTSNMEDYFALALELAMDKEKRENYRKRIITGRDASHIFNSTRFTRDLESVYLEMWRKSKGGLKPEAQHG